MKIKTPPIVSVPNMPSHVQALTDDMRTILRGGLSFSDAQLPFQVVTVNVTSGQPINLSIQSPYTIVGCFPINTNGISISSFQTNSTNGIFTATLTLSVTTATSISFLVVGA